MRTVCLLAHRHPERRKITILTRTTQYATSSKNSHLPMVLTTYLNMCALWSWPLWPGSRLWHTIWSWTTTVWNIIQIQHSSKELWPRHGFWLCTHCVLDLGDKVMTHLWMMDNNRLKYSDGTRGSEVIIWKRCDRTDRQEYNYMTPKTLFEGV